MSGWPGASSQPAFAVASRYDMDSLADKGNLNTGRHHMRFNPPTIIIFALSFILAMLAVVTKIGVVPIPRYLPHQEFWLAIVAYFILMTGCVFRGL